MPVPVSPGPGHYARELRPYGCRVRTSTAVVLDAAIVVIFVAIGRSNHHEATSLIGFLGTLWPFATGLFAGIALSRCDRERLPAGVVTWISTLVVGMLLRVVSGQGIAASFVVVAAIFLGATFLGWRVAARQLGLLHARS